MSDPTLRARTILALDAAGSSCSAALFALGKIQAQTGEAMGRGQSERLVPMIQEVMAAASCGFDDLDAIAVTCGPGGFTGVRIGLAAARGLALALDLPVIGLSNFEVLAAAVPAMAPDQHLLAAIDAKRAEVYVQVFAPQPGAGAPRPLGPGCAVRPDALAAQVPTGPLVLIGDAATVAGAALRAAGRSVEVASSEDLCLAAVAAELAAARPLPGPGALPPRPIYLRGADVTLPDGRKAQAVP